MLSIIIPARNEIYLQRTIEDLIEKAVGEIEIIAVCDAYWPHPAIQDHPRVNLIHFTDTVGQRAAYNAGVAVSKGEWIMKLDGHAAVSPGFDKILCESCGPKTTVIPEMRRLDVRKWEPKHGGRTHYMYFGTDYYCHYWQQYKKRPEAKGDITEVMNGQGSCWVMRREWNDYLGGLDEAAGSWGKVGIEIACKTWLCGGTHLVDKRAWQAHWFRASEGGFPYPFTGRNVVKSHKYAEENWFFKDTGAFPNQTRPFRWLIEKFQPPSWELYMAPEARRVMVYYTDSQIEDSLADSVRKNLMATSYPYPIISVSQKPLDFGENICVGEKPRSNRSILEQALVGVKAAPEGSVIYLCEHDVLYAQSHFAFIPKQKNACYYNRHRYYWKVGMSTYEPVNARKTLSMCVCYREYLIAKLEQALAEDEPSTNLKTRYFTYTSEKPNIDIRHDNNFTHDGKKKARYYEGKSKKAVKNIGQWGSPSHMMKGIKYKGTLRTDIIKDLIKKHKYTSYLEIGVRKNENFNKIECDHKDGVDPNGKGNYKMTSDEFFAQNKRTYDLIFIDGLHHSEQVEKDIINSLAVLNPNGVIVMHDCNPVTKEQQARPQNGQRIWCGDVWKAFVKLRTREDLLVYVVDTNNGIGIVRRGAQEPIEIPALEYEQLQLQRERLLNLVSVEQFKKREGIKN